MSRPATVALSKVRVPLPLLFGKYELLSDEELRDLIDDLTAEVGRRAS